MATKLQTVFDAFWAKMSEDDWTGWSEEEVARDLVEILNGAIPYFKFPKKSLEFKVSFGKYDNFIDGEFNEDLNNHEIQILATYMKVEWLNRTILTWENVKPLYYEKDFSQANLIDKFKQLLEREEKKALKLESIYYRSIDRKPFDYGRLAEN